jgi:hypothetical protein
MARLFPVEGCLKLLGLQMQANRAEWTWRGEEGEGSMNRMVHGAGNRGRLAGRRWSAGLLGLAAFALGAVSLAPALLAQNAAPAARAVRLSSVDGQVQISQGSQMVTAQAVANTPLFEGTLVATADDGRAEIQFEDGSVARLSPNSGLTLAVLRGQGGTGDAEVVLEGGLGYFELQGGGQAGAIRVRFGDSVVTSSGFTVLRINLDNPPGVLAVFSGNAHLERGSALALDLHGGQSVTLNGADASQYNLAESIEPDSWDAWNSDRDQVLTAEAAAQTGVAKGFANSNNPAWNDLDANGNWYNVPGEGYIWSPYEASGAGWDPYGNGSWMWTPRFGYIWASGYGWGYMPYQCGMWNYYDAFGWGWAPGLSGCNPWWYGGGYGGYYGPNIGAVYGGYRPPLRPRSRLPIGVTPRPVIAVNRHPTGGNTGLPVRARNAPVVIAGHSVAPLRTLSPRQQYDRPGQGVLNRTTPGNGGTAAQGPRWGTAPMGVRPGGEQPRGTAPGYSGVRPANPSAPRPSGGQNNVAPSRSYSSGGVQPSHPSSSGSYSGSSQPSRSSSGGSYSSGGGASRSSSGGYSGGSSGGSSHSSGGSSSPPPSSSGGSVHH